MLVSILFSRPIVLYDFARHLPMLDQFATGLSSFGVLDVMKQNRPIMEALFVAKHSNFFVPITDKFLDRIDAEFSEDGSNRKDKEVDIHKFFCDFVQDTDCLPEQGICNIDRFHMTSGPSYWCARTKECKLDC